MDLGMHRLQVRDNKTWNIAWLSSVLPLQNQGITSTIGSGPLPAWTGWPTSPSSMISLTNHWQIRNQNWCLYSPGHFENILGIKIDAWSTSHVLPGDLEAWLTNLYRNMRWWLRVKAPLLIFNFWGLRPLRETIYFYDDMHYYLRLQHLCYFWFLRFGILKDWPGSLFLLYFIWNSLMHSHTDCTSKS